MVRISDLEILEALKENSRASFMEMARRFGVTETAIRKRVRKLEDNGIILKYTIDVDTRKAGLGINAVIGLDTKPEAYMSTIDRLKSMKDVRDLRTSTGDHMILVDVWLESPEELSKFVKKIERIPGVTKTCPAIITDRLK